MNQRIDFYSLLAAPARSPEIPESADVYGWLCGSWDLEVLHYRGIDVAARGLMGEVHAGRVLEGRAVQDVWIMPRRPNIAAVLDRGMNMYGTTLARGTRRFKAWRIAWTNPVSGHREEQVGRWNGRDILQEGTRAGRHEDAVDLHGDHGNSFHWRGEALYPDNETWTLEGEFIAKRRPS